MFTLGLFCHKHCHAILEKSTPGQIGRSMFLPFLETVRKATTQGWDFLTRPSPSITDQQTRQQSRLFASLLLAAMLAIFVLIIFSTRTSNTLSGAGVWLFV